MIKLKQAIASLLAVTLLVGAVASCAGTTDEGETTTTTAATTTEAGATESDETEADETDADETETDADETEASETDAVTEAPDSDPVAFTIMSSIWGDHEKSLNDDDSNDILDEFMARTNTEITYRWFPADQYANRVTTTLSGGDIPEVINGAMALLVEQGAALPLDDLLAEHGPNILASYEDHAIEAAKLRSVEDGATYAIPFALIYPPAYSWSIRTDWLANVGIDEKPETWDEWYAVWDAFKNEDPDGDGNPDNNIPYSGDIYSLMPAFGMNVSNRNGIMIDENNNYTIAMESPYFDEYLDTMRDMHEKGYLDAEFAQRGVYVGNVDLQDAVNAGIVGSTFTWAEITRTATAGLGEVIDGAALEGVQPPTGPNGHSGIPSRAMITPTSVITIAAEDNDIAGDIVKYFDYLYSDEGTILSSYGIEGEHHEIVDGAPVLNEDVGATFVDARAAGLNFTPLAHHFDAAAYESIMLAGNTYETSTPETQLFYDALYVGEGSFFNQTPTMNTEANIEYSTDVFSQLGSALAEAVAGVISVDEFWTRYDNLMNSGLSEILEQGNEAWQAMQG